MKNTILRLLICLMFIALTTVAFSGCDETKYVYPTTQSNMATTVDVSPDSDSTCEDAGALVIEPENGDVSGIAPTLIYTPDPDFTGTDRFTWVIECTEGQITFDVQITVTENSTPLPQGEGDWLHTIGNRIVDRNDNTVWLTGANWFGFNASERVFHGLWTAHLETTIQQISQRGINILRVPISTQLLAEWMDSNDGDSLPELEGLNYYANPELEGMTSLEVFDYSLALCEKYGLKVLLDVHSPEADNAGHFVKMWYTDTIKSDIFFSTWAWVAERYKDNDTLIAFDLENEPHGSAYESPRAKWDGSSNEDNWKYACEEASKGILEANPNVLVLCEGIEVYPIDSKDWSTASQFYGTWWGGNLRGVADYPIDLGSDQDQLAYSPHDYGPSVSGQSWFEGDFTMQSLYDDVWYPNWFFIQEQNIAPLLIGEWGGYMDGGDNEKWMGLLRDFIVQNHIHHTFWCINPNSGDTGGLLENDWTTWDEAKHALLKPALWQDQNGKFVGLDHEVPLGGTNSTSGVSLDEFYQNGGSPPNP